MDASERARLRALHEAATPGPWRADGGDVIASNGGARVTEYVATVDWPMDEDGDPYASDAALIAASRTALPALLDALDATERERDALLAMLRNLLARVHRDGGQHADAVGLDAATREADEIIAQAFAELARLREPRPSAIVLQPVDPMLLCGLPCACDEWGTGHLDGCPNGDESTDGRDA